MRRETGIASLLFIILLGCSFATYGVTAHSQQNIGAQNAGVGGHSFSESYWNSTTDFMDFLRYRYPGESIPADPHLNIYTVWVNQSSIPLQMLYLGFINYTYGKLFNMTMPMQLILERYRTPANVDVVLSSSFMMLMAFNDSSGSNIPNTPDENDTVWVSLTTGATPLLHSFNKTTDGRIRNIDTSVHVEPLQMNVTAPNHYEWGMRYRNLLSLWMRLHMSSIGEGMASTADISPLKAISVFSELTFIYDMDINPATATSPGNATIRMSYRIGEFTHLWTIGLQRSWYQYQYGYQGNVDYYNRTSSQRLYGTGSPPYANISAYLTGGHYKLSLTFYQKVTPVVSKTLTYQDDNGNAAADHDRNFTLKRVGCLIGGKKILETALGTNKVPYQLYDQNGPYAYDSVAYTRRFHGLRDHSAFGFGGSGTLLWGSLGHVIHSIEPRLAHGTMIDFASSDFIFTVSYPVWSGYTIVHDPYFAVYTTPTASTGGAGATGVSEILLLVVGAAVVMVVAAVVVLRRRK